MKAAARKKADSLLAVVRGGGDFAGAARQHSQDPGSAAKGGIYPPAPKGQWAPEFDAAIFDQGGLWTQSTGLVNNTSQNIPGASYATRLSSRINWISDVFNGRVAPGDPDGGGGIPVPEPSAALVMGGAALASFLRRRRR